MRKAIVLGTSAGGNEATQKFNDEKKNIGDAIRRELSLEADWSVYGHTCEVGPGEYDVPALGEKWAMADALVVSLGMTDISPFSTAPREKIEGVIRACLTLPLLCAQQYVYRREGRGGHIVFIGSYAHRHPFSNGAMYCAAKAGIEMATKTLAWDLTPQGFIVNCVHPYHVSDTPMWEGVQAGVMKTKGMTREEADRYAEKDMRTSRLSNGEDVAVAVRETLESESAYFRSGSSIELFGGTR